MSQNHHRLKYVLLLSIAPLLWGLGFVGVRWALEEYSATWLNCIRFLYCLPIILPYFFFKKTFHRPLRDFIPSIYLGVVLAIALWVQSIGIGMTSIAKAGFLTVLYAFFTPCIEVFIFNKKISPRFWLSLLIALVGVAALYELKWQSFNTGDGFVVLSAILFSVHILLIDRYSKLHISAYELNFLQILVMFIVTLFISLSLEPIPNLAPLVDLKAVLSPSPIAGFIILSFLSNIVAYSIQITAQKHISAHIAGMVFLIECIAAVVYGYMFFGESLGFLGVIGSIVIFMALLLAISSKNQPSIKASR